MTDHPVVYTIADTHLGLRERGKVQSRDAPQVVAGFLRWLSRLQPAGEAIPVWGTAGLGTRVLQPPSHLILLGDILELWDAENQTVLLSAASVLPCLTSLPGEIVYVLGNHDNILEGSAGTYPIAAQAMTVVPDVFPAPAEDGTVRPMRIGDRDYVFLHGHQLDRHFLSSGGTWRWLGHLRQIGAAMGSYAWIFLLLLIAGIFSVLAVVPVLAAWFLLATLVLLFFPRAYMTVGRRLWVRFFGMRYRRSAAREGFAKWWERFHAQVGTAEGLTIVYGHTHVLDRFAAETSEPSTAAGASSGYPPTSRGSTAYNISSWISARGGYETVTSATLLYADTDGPLFLGWDWNAARPFHIPDEFVTLRGTRRLSPSEAEVAVRLRWPEKLIGKWRETDEKVRKVWSSQAKPGRNRHDTTS